MTARLMLTAALARVKAAITYDLIDDGQDPGDQGSNFGLFDFDFKPKPAATAFYTIAKSRSRRTTRDQTIPLCLEVVRWNANSRAIRNSCRRH